MYNISKPLEADCPIVALWPWPHRPPGSPRGPGTLGSLCCFFLPQSLYWPLSHSNVAQWDKKLASLDTNHPGPLSPAGGLAGPRPRGSRMVRDVLGEHEGFWSGFFGLSGRVRLVLGGPGMSQDGSGRVQMGPKRSR